MQDRAQTVGDLLRTTVVVFTDIAILALLRDDDSDIPDNRSVKTKFDYSVAGISKRRV